MKNLISFLFMLLIVVHLKNGDIVKFDNKYKWETHTAMGRLITITIWEGVRAKAVFNGAEVLYVERKEND